MTNTHTHTTRLIIVPSDVALDLVLNVACSAAEPLCGRPVAKVTYETQVDSQRRLVDVEIHYWAANDNEALRTGQVLRSAILPLVRGCTNAGTHAGTRLVSV